MLAAMKSFPPPHSTTRRAQPALRPAARPQVPTTMRSTVLLSLLLSPDGGVDVHRHGHGRPSVRHSG
jgi:hypothetical protein